MEETKAQPEKHKAVLAHEPADEPEQPTETEQTRILLGVSQSTRGYPHPSQSSLHALDWILQKLIHKHSRNEFKLQIVHVKVPDEDGLDEVDSLYATGADIDAAKQKALKKCFQLLEVFVRKCREAEVPVEGWVIVGDPRDAICNEVVRVKPDLLILGSRGLGPLQRAFVGSVSRHCSKKVECPVLIIRRKPEDMPEDASED